MPGWHAEIFLRGLSQVELPPLPAAAIRPAANSRGDNGHARRGPEPPPYLRRLLQSGGSDLPGEQAAADGAQQPQVPVILAVAPGSQAVAVNASSGRIIDAAGVNTTRCIRYAPGFDASAGAAQSGSSGGSGGEGGGSGGRPPLDLSGCAAAQLVVASSTQAITIQVGRGASLLLLLGAAERAEAHSFGGSKPRGRCLVQHAGTPRCQAVGGGGGGHITGRGRLRLPWCWPPILIQHPACRCA
jgi:hypothetical protein